MPTKIYFFYLLFFSSFLFAENPDTTIARIKVLQSQIIEAAERFNINATYLSAIIYTERTLNFDWKDEALDILIAKRGYNSSVGFCQIKIKTAYWIEMQLNDSLSAYFPNKKYFGFLNLSKSPKELLNKLSNVSLNIYYAAGYLRIIQSYWEKAGFSIDKKPEIIGTLYSIGMFANGGKPRKPHANPKANWFGKEVNGTLYMSSKNLKGN